MFQHLLLHLRGNRKAFQLGPLQSMGDMNTVIGVSILFPVPQIGEATIIIL